jgi:hypothetical protein
VKLHRLLLLFLALTAAACSSDAGQGTLERDVSTTPSPLQPPSQSSVRVTSVRVFIKDSRPQAFVQGELGDGCTSLASVGQQRANNTIDISLTSVRQGEVCTMIMQYVNQWVALNAPLNPGDYTVRANGVAVQFRLVRSSTGELRVEPDPGPIPQPPYLPFRGR